MALGGGLYAARKDGLSQATLDFPHRVYSSKILPSKAPNGSTVIVTGHSQGITIAWRGGKRFKSRSLLDPRDRATPDSAYLSDGFESDEEDIHFSQAYQQHIIHRKDIHLSVAVTDLSLCSLQSSVFIAAVCSDRSVRLFKQPLSASSSKNALGYGNVDTLRVRSNGTPICISMTWTGKESQNLEPLGKSMAHYDLLLAVCSDSSSGRLSVTRVPADFVGGNDEFSPCHSQILRKPAGKISFCPTSYPSPTHAEILVCYQSGSVSVFDPFTTPKTGLDHGLGAWLITLTPSFTSYSNVDASAPSMVDYERILDAEWTQHGRSIMALLANGQWGFWDRRADALSYNKSFVMSGHLSTIHRAKEHYGATTAPTRGGLAVTHYHAVPGEATDEYVTLWFDEAIYTIISVEEFRTKKTRSLFGPTLFSVKGFRSMGQIIVAASIIPPAGGKSKGVPSPFLKVTPKAADILVTSETRLHFLVPEPTRAELANAMEKRENEEARDREAKTLLAHGILGIGGMDRMLESMSSSALLENSGTPRASTMRAKSNQRGSSEDSAVLIVSPNKKLSWGKDQTRVFDKREVLGKTTNAGQTDLEI